jgi:hypothetical protein
MKTKTRAGKKVKNFIPHEKATTRHEEALSSMHPVFRALHSRPSIDSARTCRARVSWRESNGMIASRT